MKGLHCVIIRQPTWAMLKQGPPNIPIIHRQSQDQVVLDMAGITMYRDEDSSMGDIVVRTRAAEDGVTRSHSRMAIRSGMISNKPLIILPGRLMVTLIGEDNGEIPHAADRKNSKRCRREKKATAAAKELHHTGNTMGEVASIQEGREPIVGDEGGCNQVAEDDESTGRAL